MGAEGAIGTTYSFVGELFVALQRAVEVPDRREARRLQVLGNHIIDALVTLGVIPATKAALEFMGQKAGPPREPFTALGGAGRERLGAALEPLLAWRRERRPAV